jgi:hypothetical protein
MDQERQDFAELDPPAGWPSWLGWLVAVLFFFALVEGDHAAHQWVLANTAPYVDTGYNLPGPGTDW